MSSIDPTGSARAVSAVSQVVGAVDSATKPGGVFGRLVGVDLVRQEVKSLGDEIGRAVALLEQHHGRHEQAALAIGGLLSQVRHVEQLLQQRVDAIEKLTEARAQAQERSLREFEARLGLLSEMLKERSSR